MLCACLHVCVEDRAEQEGEQDCTTQAPLLKSTRWEFLLDMNKRGMVIVTCAATEIPVQMTWAAEMQFLQPGALCVLVRISDAQPITRDDTDHQNSKLIGRTAEKSSPNLNWLIK